MKRITAAMLGARETCCVELDIFRYEWPRGVVPTLKSVRRAQELGLPLCWAAGCLFSPLARRAYFGATSAAGRAFDKAASESAARAHDEAVAVAWLKGWRQTCGAGGTGRARGSALGRRDAPANRGGR